MVVRIVGAVFVGISVLLAGCGADTKPAPTPTVSAEDQIRDVISALSEAQGTSDLDKVAEMTCAKYRDRVSGLTTDDVPPMSALPLDVFSTMPPEQLAQKLGAEYAGASEESVRALVDALLRRDEPSYKVAMAEVMAQSLQIRVDKIENIVVNGDTATADVTVVISTGGKISHTSDANKVTLVKEDGQWKDCTPPDET